MKKELYIAIAALCLAACNEGETDNVSQELTRTAIDSTDVATADQPIDGSLEISTDDIGTGDAADAV